MNGDKPFALLSIFEKEHFLSNTPATRKKPYFSTRDLLIMAVLAALGGVASTYVNAVSDAMHAILGFPGATQWAAGLHVLWIVLAMGITGRTGTGTITGILKGTVELMSGNTHGVIVLLVNLVAGLLVDFGFLIFRGKGSLLSYLIAGGLATASNVLVFQLFATLPQNILAATAIAILFGVALVSGLVFAGIIPRLLISLLTKAGVVKKPDQPIKAKQIGWAIVGGVLILSIFLGLYLKISLQGPEKIQIDGAVSQPYAFPTSEFDIEEETRQMAYRGVMTEYTGFPLAEIVNHARPLQNADTLLIQAADGYAFLLSFVELETNPNILLVVQGQGKNASFDIVGPTSSKAWVRNVTQLTVIAAENLLIKNPAFWEAQFDPDAWLESMDSTQINLPQGARKLQGVPVWKIVQAHSGADQAITQVQFVNDTDSLTLEWSELDSNDNIRIFTVIDQEGISYALARMSGEVLLFPVKEIVIE
jgi:energy-coupling factor transport system substrate-specific component